MFAAARQATLQHRPTLLKRVAVLLLLPIVISSALPALVFAGGNSATNSPDKPTWWHKYQ
jgi:hypothetical protein